MKEKLHSICVLLGSNIEAEKNLPQTISLLKKQVTIVQLSSVWESKAIGSDGPNFLNAAVLITSPLDASSFKTQILSPLENQMGRLRTLDKNSPRTIDLDIIIFDMNVLDQNLWRYAHCAVPVSEIFPDYTDETGESLKNRASSLASPISIWRKENVNLS